MQVTQMTVTIRELTDGYYNDDVEGVAAYDERLNVRPPYQREFVYDQEQQEEVIRSVMAGFPLNVFYWAVAPGDTFEMLDGQQRTMSICEYVEGSYSVDGLYFENQPADVRARILDYELTVYVCDGTDSEKLHWFRIINISGEALTEQELWNAIYAGPWVTSARAYFSKPNGPAYQIASEYMSGTAIRQDYLHTVICWAAEAEGVSPKDYMGRHQSESDAKHLWNEFRRAIRWVKKTYPTVYSDMKGVEWVRLWREHKDDEVYHVRDGSTRAFDPQGIDAEIKRLRDDPDISNKGIYEFVLTGDRRLLTFRRFDRRDQLDAYAAQGHKCPLCIEAARLEGKGPEAVEELPIEKMHADHIKPWSDGGTTTRDNLQMLCIKHNLAKSDKQ